MSIRGKILSSFMSIVLVAGLCPGLAFADRLVPGQVSATASVDLSSGILQRGGLNGGPAPSAASSGIRTQAASNTAGFEKALRKAAESWNGTDSQTKVDVSAYNIPTDKVSALYQRFCNENGQYFFLSGSAGWNYNSATKTVTEFYVYFDNKNFSKSDIDKFSAAAKAALSGVVSGWSDEQKALYLHDWVVTHCDYDLTYSNYSAYDVLVSGSAVCQGYALAYDYLLGQAGVGCEVITSRGINHAWNLATIGGKTYYVDCTWDDPSNIKFEAYCAHGNFLRSKAAFGHTGNDGTVSDWVNSSGANVFGSSSVAASTTYDKAYWSDVKTAIPHVGSLWAYVNSTWAGDTATVRAHDYSTGKDRVLASGLPGVWRAWGNPLSYYTTYYTSLVSNGEAFLASSPTALYRIGTDGSKAVAYSLSDSEAGKGYVYGLSYDASKKQCRYQLGESLSGSVSGSGAYAFSAASVAADGVSLSKTSLSVERGKTSKLVATVSPSNATNKTVTWSSSKTSVATVSSAGVVKGIAAGKAVVTAKTADGGFMAKCTVTVKPTALTSKNTTISSIPAKTYTGRALTPAPTVKFGSTALKKGTDYTLSYSGNKNAGTATVKVTGAGNYSGTVSKTFAINKAANPMSVAGKTATVTYNKKKASTVKVANAFKFAKAAVGAVSYARVAKGSSGYLAVSSKGVVTVKAGAPKKVHALNVKVTAKGGPNHKSASKIVAVKVRVK